MAIVPLVQNAAAGVETGVLTPIQRAQDYVDSLVSKNILKPKGMQGIEGFVFDYVGDEQVRLENEITDHYSESNLAIQDHIAKKPARLVLRGFVSELVLPASNSGIGGLLTTLQNKLGVVPAYLGKYTPSAVQQLSKAVTQAQSYANTANLYLARARNVVGFFAGAAAVPTRQQAAFDKLSSLRETGWLCTVETPWHIFNNMAIEILSFVQPEDSRSASDISVTLKEIRTVDVVSVPNITATHGGRSAFQAQPQVNNGRISGAPSSLGSVFPPTNSLKLPLVVPFA